jgi:transcription elongation GreA/GreB family factor
MSRAFVKESEDTASDLDLPERSISPHRNLVTPSGFAEIESAVRRLEDELAAARAADDRGLIARCQRDLRYWNQRRASAEVVPPAPGHGRVRFGSTVTVQLADGTRRAFRIVGEDEADPAAGKIAYVAPVAAGMIGTQLGDSVATGAGDGEIVEIQ